MIGLVPETEQHREARLEPLKHQMGTPERGMRAAEDLAAKTKRPKLFRVMGRSVEQPSPEYCSQSG